MKGLKLERLDLRTRLIVAMVAVALLAVGLAGLIGNLGLTLQLDQAARNRLADSATHVAEIAATSYESSGSWATTATELDHVAALNGLRIELRLPMGRLIEIGSKPGSPSAEAAVLVSGQSVATVVVSEAGGSLLTSEEQHLRRSLDQLHLVAAGVAASVAIAAAVFLAQTLTRPLRRIRAAAERIANGDLGVRGETSTEPEMRAVGRAFNRLAETLTLEEDLRKASVADLAHELRTPVNGLLVRIEAAQDGVLPLSENLSAMHDDARRLTRLLDDLARLADAEQPGLLVDKQPVDLSEVARGVADSYVARFAEAHIKFTAHVAPVSVSGDSGRLEQIVANLLQNALRYTEPGGEVMLRVARSDSEAVLEVTDTGIGIQPSDLRHIYTRFWRGDPSRSRSTGGTGIGLAIVRELVQAHEGRIEVDSTPGSGSRFRVVMPALKPAPKLS